MKVYSVSFDVENYRLLVPEHEADLDSGNLWINGTSKLQLWQAPLMRYATQEGVEKIADITQITPGFFAFNEKAMDSLSELLKMNGELFELVVEDKTLFAFNPNNEIDCFNAKASEWHIRRNGKLGRLIKPAFVHSKLNSVTIFQVPESLQNAFYVTEHFKNTYEKSALSGLIFEQCLSV